MRFAAVRVINCANRKTGHWFVPKTRYVCGHWIFPLDWLNDYPKRCLQCGAEFAHVDMNEPPP